MIEVIYLSQTTSPGGEEHVKSFSQFENIRGKCVINCELIRLGEINIEFYYSAETAEAMSKESPYFEYKFPKQLDKFSKEKMELETKLDEKKKELQEKQMQRKIHELQDKVRELSQIESQLEEKTRRLQTSNKERDILEKELITTRSELASLKRTLGKI